MTMSLVSVIVMKLLCIVDGYSKVVSSVGNLRALLLWDIMEHEPPSDYTCTNAVAIPYNNVADQRSILEN